MFSLTTTFFQIELFRCFVACSNAGTAIEGDPALAQIVTQYIKGKEWYLNNTF
jgi:hypothetical protein